MQSLHGRAVRNAIDPGRTEVALKGRDHRLGQIVVNSGRVYAVSVIRKRSLPGSDGGLSIKSLYDRGRTAPLPSRREARSVSGGTARFRAVQGTPKTLD
jgi:hypothetical protein